MIFINKNEAKDKEIIINDVFDICDGLNGDEEVDIEGFGVNSDLLLNIKKDSYYNKEKDPDYSNLVAISTKMNGKWVDDTGNVYCDSELYEQLERIYNYKDFKTL